MSPHKPHLSLSCLSFEVQLLLHVVGGQLDMSTLSDSLHVHRDDTSLGQLRISTCKLHGKICRLSEWAPRLSTRWWPSFALPWSQQVRTLVLTQQNKYILYFIWDVSECARQKDQNGQAGYFSRQHFGKHVFRSICSCTSEFVWFTSTCGRFPEQLIREFVGRFLRHFREFLSKYCFFDLVVVKDAVLFVWSFKKWQIKIISTAFCGLTRTVRRTDRWNVMWRQKSKHSFEQLDDFETLSIVYFGTVNTYRS